MSDGYEDLPYLFEKNGFHDRASALKRLIAERDALLQEAVEFRKEKQLRVEEKKAAELAEVEAAYESVSRIRGEARGALVRFGRHLDTCRFVTHSTKPADWTPDDAVRPNLEPCDCGLERAIERI